MVYLIYVIRFYLCAISMVLTGLFALSISGIVLSDLIFLLFNPLDRSATTIDDQWLIAILFVSIGICIDLSKFIFWCATHSQYYRVISLFLMLFSWLASLSYFVTTESESILRVQRLSPEYAALTHRLDAIDKTLLVNEQLLEKRLSSEYHKQWALAKKTVRANETLSKLSASLEVERATAGREYAVERAPVSRFFVEVGRWLGVSDASVRIVSFGTLALLLEVCALASISLVISGCVESDQEDEKIKRIMKLKEDILSGRVAPVIRKILSENYKLGITSIRAVLDELIDEGVLEGDKNRTYRLKT